MPGQNLQNMTMNHFKQNNKPEYSNMTNINRVKDNELTRFEE